jgi:hypothetical protein
MRGEKRLRRQFPDLVDDALLRVGRDGCLGLLHRENDVLSVLGDLREHCQHEHIDGAGALPVIGRGVTTFARGDEGGDHLP